MLRVLALGLLGVWVRKSLLCRDVIWAASSVLYRVCICSGLESAQPQGLCRTCISRGYLAAQEGRETSLLDPT